MILDELATEAARRVAEAKARVAPEALHERARCMPALPERAFEAALRAANGRAVIGEVKRASPSKGILAEQFDPLSIAKTYASAGVSCISVLTEPSRFLGADRYLQEIAAAVACPVLRKDFVVDPYQIDEARCLGASAVLLICALLDDRALAENLTRCRELGLGALVEAHTREEVQRAVTAGARMIGVNNRDLRTFSVDLQTCIRLRECVPAECVYVAESGILSVQDADAVFHGGADAVLVGELLVKSEDPAAVLAALRGVRA